MHKTSAKNSRELEAERLARQRIDLICTLD